MVIVAFVMVRTGSSRLPGKAMADLGGQPMWVRVFNRVSRAKRLDKVVVATTTNPRDDVVAQICAQRGWPCFRGEEYDVLDRYYQAAKAYDAEVIVRISTDCALIDPEIIDHVVEAFQEKKPDYASNTMTRTYPVGLDLEVMTFDALSRAWREAKEPYQRMHCTPYIYRNPSKFRLLNVGSEKDYSNYRWVVDTAEDLDFVRAVYASLGNVDTFSWRDVLKLLSEEPGLIEINQHIRQQTDPKLAIYDGRPIRDEMLPYGHQTIDEDDIRAVVEVLRSDWITTGPKVGEFEKAFADYLGVKYAVSFSSGTAALHGAVFAAGLGAGDEAITTPMTFCATSNCLLYQGAKPVFVDVCPDTLNIDAEGIASRITPRTKAIIAVDYAGHPADLDALLDIARQHGLIMIEDACHALGAEYKGNKVGGISDLSAFSFHPVKHVTTGEGGMVTTDSPEYARRLRIFRNHGIDSDPRQRTAKGQWYYEMVALGYNYRLTDVACALGLSQLRMLGPNLKRRGEIAHRYTEALRTQAAVVTPTVRRDVNPAWHIYPIRLDLTKLKMKRDAVFRALLAEGIGVNVHYIPVHLHPYYKERFGYRGGEYPVAEDAYERLITLPLFPAMTDHDVEDVIDAVTKVLRFYAA
jgi:perosamine synthetase